MLKHPYILPKIVTQKGVLRFVKKAFAGNIAFALIVIPGINVPITTNTINNEIVEPQNNLIIPEANLASSFNIPANTSPTIQIPVDYMYVSQWFSAYHPGIDLPSEYASPIKPVEAGVVTLAAYSPFGYGNEVIIDHGNGYESLYAHMSKIKVKKGDLVDNSTIIGLIGITGHSTGPHLHLEIHKNGKAINPVGFLPPLTKTRLLITSNLQ